MAQEIKIGDMVEVISSKHAQHWLEILQIVEVLYVSK